MFDWLGDIFNEDTFKTLIDGVNTVGTAFNAAKPIINAGAQIGLGLEGNKNAEAYRAANQAALAKLDDMFNPTGSYASELRKQMERKDAAAGRRSQYGTRETELMTNLAKQKASVLTSPAYQAFLQGANRSTYAPIGGAIGNLTGGLAGLGTGQQPGQAGSQQGGSGKQFGPSNGLSGASSLAQYMGGLFGPGAEASIAQLGGAGAALGAGGGMAGGALGSAGQGVVDSLGSLLGGSPFLPGYSGGATGIFGGAGVGTAPVGESGGGLLGDAGNALGVAGDVGSWLGGAGAFGGAGGALSGMGAGSLAGTVGGADALGGLLGGTGFLPSYGAAGGTTATGLFGGGAAAGGAGAGAGGAASAGSAGSLLGGAPAGMAAVTALPFLAAVLGFTGALDSDDERSMGTELEKWQNTADIWGNPNRQAYNINPNRGETYDQFLQRAIGTSNFGAYKWDQAAEPYVRSFYDQMIDMRGGIDQDPISMHFSESYDRAGDGG